MKVYKVELLVLDFENMGERDIITQLENTRYVHGSVMNIVGRDIGEWDDSHPLNHHDKAPAEYERLFG